MNAERMMKVRKWRLDWFVDGEWKMYGMFGANFINQLAASVEYLVKQGYEVYKTIKIVEVGDDG